MDLKRILAELHDERRQVNDAIQSLERLTLGAKGVKNVPTESSGPGLDGGKRGRTASPAARVKNARAEVKTRAKTAGS